MSEDKAYLILENGRIFSELSFCTACFTGNGEEENSGFQNLIKNVLE